MQNVRPAEAMFDGGSAPHRRATWRGPSSGAQAHSVTNRLTQSRRGASAFAGADHHGRNRSCQWNGREGLRGRSEEHTSELQSLMRISYAVFCLKKKIQSYTSHSTTHCQLKRITAT